MIEFAALLDTINKKTVATFIFESPYPWIN